MKKIIVALFAMLLTGSAAAAGGFAGYGYTLKDDQNKDSYHDVHAFTFGTTITDRATVSVKGEVENVRSSNDSLEGLIVADAKYNVYNFNVGVPVAAFVNVGVGQKFKQTNNFPIYVAGGSLKWKLSDDFAVITAGRWRDAFQAGRNYGTVEGSLGAEYTLAQHHVLGVRAAYERGELDRGTSAYNTIGASYSYKF